ncbi:TRAP transporter permease [Ectothiorhodospira marina]|uniref:TRAP transporter, 4TM/12TM fusion protein n=1 Tax=Ectothiorhodospira marina TaxID=1396821 RepID=A0A1H7FCW7_9GAMM|nr:TRAP transporter permease [Ectothiorhodospira marina]SEK23147.1 TRAP transporter, 4TM/12TM fusion protein [Ectothiorhodospira marina]
MQTDHQGMLAGQVETGAREPGVAARRLIYGVALAWSLFQIWIASPLPYWVDLFIVSETKARSIHLAFAVLLAFLAFPAVNPMARTRPLAGYFFILVGLGLWALAGYQVWQEMPRAGVFATVGAAVLLAAWPLLRPATLDRVPAVDWLLALLAALCAGYLFLFHEALAQRPGAPTMTDLIIAGIGMALLLEATRRVLGPALMVIAVIFLVYTFAGPWMPDLIAHRGASFARAMSQQWLSNEGVFGIALGVSTSFVFLFVLFGALLEKAGAGGYFIRVAFSLLGHLRGGPAKAAVVASGMTGMVSGSSIANVVTTGTFTIPLMKRVGFPAYKAGAVEVSSSVNGQLMPPVMGAAAFLMVEYVGISYVEVIRHAFLPAVIAYIALFYIVHLEALKAGMEGLPRRVATTVTGRLIAWGLTLSGLFVLAGATYYGLGWIKAVSGDASPYIIGMLVLAAYLSLLWTACRAPAVQMVDDDHLELPDPRSTIQGGLHFLLPVVVLVWCLVVERLSPGLSAFWAVAFMVFIMLTQRPLIVLFRGQGAFANDVPPDDPAARQVTRALLRGGHELANGLVQGARNMVGIGVATAAAGIIVGTVAMTGIGLAMTDMVGFLSGGNLLLMLMLTGLICLVLGLGLPTTANYIIVATLMAPVIVELGSQHGLLIPLIAAHLFVFYFGIMADVTPPVGLASFAAAAVSRADPIRTGMQAFIYSLRTVTLPFLFVFNTQLLLIGVNSLWQLLLTVFGALVGILVFAAATQGWLFTRNRIHESILLLGIALVLFAPNLLMDRIEPRYDRLPPGEIQEVAEAAPRGGQLRFAVEGMDMEGREVERVVMLPMGDPGPGEERLTHAGLGLMTLGDQVSISFVSFGSPADRMGLESGWNVTEVMVPADRPAPEWFYLPALLLLGGIVALQRRRARR